MIYKNFEDHITRKHGIVVEGWPLRMFDNPSAIGSHVELNVLLRAWETGATRFRKMTEDEYMSWMESRANLEAPSTAALGFPPAIALPQPGVQDASIILPIVLPIVPSIPPADLLMPAIHPSFNIISLESVTTPQTNNSAPKKTRKTRSDKGKTRKKPSQVPGATIFHAGTH
jgi:hypothetical protein